MRFRDADMKCEGYVLFYFIFFLYDYDRNFYPIEAKLW